MVDWVSMIFPVSLNIPSGKCVHLSSNGELEYESNKPTMVEGSYSSTIYLKVIPSKRAVSKRLDSAPSEIDPDCNRLYISGNPTKFLQGHNIFGSNDYMPLMYRFIEAVCVSMQLGRDMTDRLLHLTLSGRYELTRIDLTESFLLNSISDVRAWIRASAQVANGKCQSVNSYNERTLYMGKNSRRMTIKIYAKGDEIKVHKLPLEFDAPVNKCNIEQMTKKEYIQDIADRLLRVEVTLRSMALKDMGLHTGKGWDEKLIQDVFRSKVAKLNIPENTMIDADIIESMPNHLQGYLALWQNGHNLKTRLKKSQYYQVRKEMLVYGIDIKMPPAGQQSNVIPLIRYITAEPFLVPTQAIDYGLLYIPASPYNLRCA